jgi:hypothetical protein
MGEKFIATNSKTKTKQKMNEQERKVNIIKTIPGNTTQT